MSLNIRHVPVLFLTSDCSSLLSAASGVQSRLYLPLGDGEIRSGLLQQPYNNANVNFPGDSCEQERLKGLQSQPRLAAGDINTEHRAHD